MRKLEIDEIKSVEMEILDYIVEICNENNITYFLDSGTLLGAVRHKGFIPWDDDIDIICPKEDYIKLLEILSVENRYKLYTAQLTDSHLPYAKLCDKTTKLIDPTPISIEPDHGIFIDIFPLCYLPNNKIIRNIYLFRMKNLKRMWWYATMTEDIEERNVVKKCLQKIAKKNGNLYYTRLLEHRAFKYDKTKYVNGILESSDPYRVCLFEWFENRVYLVFENKEYAAPVGYAKYLEKLYGNYMELPPIEKRVQAHGFEVFRIDEE